jgi:hypothetical protein
MEGGGRITDEQERAVGAIGHDPVRHGPADDRPGEAVLVEANVRLGMLRHQVTQASAGVAQVLERDDVEWRAAPLHAACDERGDGAQAVRADGGGDHVRGADRRDDGGRVGDRQRPHGVHNGLVNASGADEPHRIASRPAQALDDRRPSHERDLVARGAQQLAHETAADAAGSEHNRPHCSTSAPTGSWPAVTRSPAA